MQALAQAWLVGTLVGWNQAVVYIGLLGIVQTLPVMVLSLFGGIMADIWPKRATLVRTQTAAGVLALILAALTYLGVVAVWHVFVLAFLLGLVNALDMPTRQAFVMEMVGAEDVANAVARNSAVLNGARILGPAIAGILIGLLGTALCFFLNGLSFGAVIVGLLLMHEAGAHTGGPPLSAPQPGRCRRQSWRGPELRLAHPDRAPGPSHHRDRDIFGLNFFNIVLPVIAASTLKVGATGFGFLSAALGAGSLLAALGVAALERPRIRVLIGGCLLIGIAEFVLASTAAYPVALAASSAREWDLSRPRLAATR